MPHDFYPLFHNELVFLQIDGFGKINITVVLLIQNVIVIFKGFIRAQFVIAFYTEDKKPAAIHNKSRLF